MEPSDIFTTITAYDKPENRFTASLVFLLKSLWEEIKKDKTKRREYYSLLNKLCGEVPWGADINFKIQRYEKGEDGRKRILDFEIASPDNVLAQVEVKDTVRITQVFKDDRRSLRKEARRRGYSYSRLVLLRHHYASTEQTNCVDSNTRWSQLYNWLKDMFYSGVFDKTSRAYYLLNEFLRYLEAKGVPMADIINMKSIEKGLSDLVALLQVVKEEAKNLFFTEEGLKKVETDIGEYREEDVGVVRYVEHVFYQTRPKREAYAVGLYSHNPERIYMAVNTDYLDAKGRKLIDVRIKEDSAFEQDYEYNRLWYWRQLESGEPDEIGRLLREMYQRLTEVTRKRRRV